MASMFAIAAAQDRLREALTVPIMQFVMKLMGTELGFLTDRDNPGKDGEQKPKYGLDTVRDCVIAAALKGLRITGNEFNIIAGKCYQAKNGTFRKITEWPGVTEFETVEGQPQSMSGGSGAAVKVDCTWKYNGKPDSLTVTAFVRVNGGMGVDAILGKAKHKAYQKVWARLSGRPIETPPGEDDENTLEGVAEPAADAATVETVHAAEPAAEAQAEPVQTQGEDIGLIYRREINQCRTISETGRVYDAWCGPESERELPQGFDAWASNVRNERNAEIRNGKCGA